MSLTIRKSRAIITSHKLKEGEIGWLLHLRKAKDKIATRYIVDFELSTKI
ncbi:hypothetical protein [Bacillus phage MrBubbles]|nr:hypothetical protein [Bacillus phage MrBubbles]